MALYIYVHIYRYVYVFFVCVCARARVCVCVCACVCATVKRRKGIITAPHKIRAGRQRQQRQQRQSRRPHHRVSVHDDYYYYYHDDDDDDDEIAYPHRGTRPPVVLLCFTYIRDCRGTAIVRKSHGDVRWIRLGHGGPRCHRRRFGSKVRTGIGSAPRRVRTTRLERVPCQQYATSVVVVVVVVVVVHDGHGITVRCTIPADGRTGHIATSRRAGTDPHENKDDESDDANDDDGTVDFHAGRGIVGIAPVVHATTVPGRTIGDWIRSPKRRRRERRKRRKHGSRKHGSRGGRWRR